MTKPRKRILTPKVSKEHVKAAAARAEARSAGEEMEHAPAPITPPIVPAAALKKAKTPKKKGRKTIYSEPLGRALCKMLASGMTLNEVCRRPLMPHERVVRMWATDPNHPFSPMYVRAREIGYSRMADQIIDIADRSVNDYMTRITKDGGVETMINRECLERTKIRIETRKWLLAKALPKIFGEKVAVDHGGKVEQVHSEAPQPTGEDHLADITKRYATKANTHMPKANGAAKPNGKANGLH